MPEIRYYVAADGREPFARWFADLEAVAPAKVTRAVVRLEQGNFSNCAFRRWRPLVPADGDHLFRSMTTGGVAA
jgi:hypothetical protein